MAGSDIPKDFSLGPGETTTIVNNRQLTVWEGWVCMQLVGEINPEELETWAGRLALAELLSPRGYRGDLETDITAMTDPKAELEKALQAGISWSAKDYSTPPNGIARVSPKRLRGYHLSALGKSTGWGPVGTIEADVWYQLLPHRNGPDDILRYLAEPDIDVESFEARRRRSQSKGWQVLRHGMTRPVNTGMGGMTKEQATLTDKPTDID